MLVAKMLRLTDALRLLKLLAVSCAFAQLIGTPVLADQEQTFSLQGFGTLGMARTTSNDLEFVRDLSQPGGIKKNWDGRGDSVLGLQGGWHINKEFEAVVQATTRYRYDRTYHPEISWAFVKYDPTPNLTLRAGRLGTEFFMMADSRWVGYSFLTVRPPGDYFWYLPFYSIHGLDAAYTVPLGEHLLRIKAFYGHSDGKIPLADRQWEIKDSPMLGGFLEYQIASWLIRASYANITFKNNLPLGTLLPASSLEYLATKDRRTDYYSLGVVYDQGPWQVQLMLNHIEQGNNALEDSNGGYLLAGYRIAQVTPYLGYSWVRSERHASPDPYASRVIADSHSDQKTSIVGMRWDVARNVAVKAQWDGVRGDPTSIFPYRNDPVNGRWSGKMDIYSLTVDFVF
ncbi:MAG: hypothetical protein H6R16_3586 [Proteobacteria bacterium]|nr:hypothetical protein [Pseudomonadota bacterium]